MSISSVAPGANYLALDFKWKAPSAFAEPTQWTDRHGNESVSDSNPEDGRTWRFDKRITLDTLVAIAGIGLVLGVPMFLWGRAMEARVQTLEIVQTQRDEQAKNREFDYREQSIRILQRMDKLDDQVTNLRIDLGRYLPKDAALKER